MRGLEAVEDVARVLPHLAVGRLDDRKEMQSRPALDFEDVGHHLTHPEILLREGRPDFAGKIGYVGAMKDVGGRLGH